MRFKTYLVENENKDINGVISEIKKKCQPFLKEFKKIKPPDNFLLSGRSTSNLSIIKKIRKDRNPLNTPIEFHNLADKLFNEKFGIKPRSNSIFVTGDYDVAESYGYLHAIFPIGNFKYIWNSKVVDFYLDWYTSIYNSIGDYLNDEFLKDFEFKNSLDKIYMRSEFIRFLKKKFNYDIKNGYIPDNTVEKDFINKWAKKIKNAYEIMLKNTISEYKMNDLKSAIKSNCEIMLLCDEILMVNYEEIENYGIYEFYDALFK